MPHEAGTDFTRKMQPPEKSQSVPPTESMEGKGMNKEEEKSRNRRYLGIVLALIAALNYSISALIIKVLMVNYHPCNFGVWRFVSMVAITTPFLIHGQFFRKVKDKGNASGDSLENEGILKQVWPPNRTTAFLILQGMLGSNSMMFVFFGLSYLDIGDSIVIGTSAPVFVSVIAWIILKEPLGVVPTMTTIVSVLGVAIICKPPVLTGQGVLSGEVMKGVAFSFSSMVLLTACYVLIRYLRQVHHALIQFCFALWGLAECLILAGAMGVLELPHNWPEAVLIAVNAGLAFTAQTCLTVIVLH